MTAADTMTAILKEDVSDLIGTNAQIPPSLDRIVRHCLEKSPAERFQSARDVAFALEALSGSSTSAFKSADDAPVAAPRRRTALRVAVAAVGAFALAASGYLYGHRNTNGQNAVAMRQVAFRHGSIGSASFANDGKTIVYAAAWDGKPYEVFSTQMPSPESRALGFTDTQVLSISKGGEMLMLRSRGTLARSSVSGGAPRDVAEGVLRADWMADGASIAIARKGGIGEIVEAPVGKKVYETAGQINALRVAGHGGAIALVDGPLAGDSSARLVIIDADGQVKVASDLWSAIDGISWSPDESEVWFSGNRIADNGFFLHAMAMNGATRVLQAVPLRWQLTDVSSDGRILLRTSSPLASMWFRAAGASAETDLYWHDFSGGRDISADLHSVLFSEGGFADNQPDFRTYVRGTNGSAAVEIGQGLGMAFSPDGQWAMTSLNAQPSQLVAYPVHAGQPRPLTSDAIRHLSGRWLPDGRRIIFVGIEAGKAPRYYVQDSPTSPPRAISDVTATFERETDPIVLSPDGAFVAAPVADGVQLLPIAGGVAHALPGVAADSIPLAWCQDDSLLIQKRSDLPAKITRVNIKSGASTVWRAIAPPDLTGVRSINAIRVGADCRTYLYSTWEQRDTLIVVSGIK